MTSATVWSEWLVALAAEIDAREADLAAGRTVARGDGAIDPLASSRPESPLPPETAVQATAVLDRLRALEDAVVEAVAASAAELRSTATRRNATAAHIAAIAWSPVAAFVDSRA